VLAATHGPPAAKKAGGSYHRSSRIIRHSLRDGFNAYGALSLGTGLSCSHRPRAHHLASLTSASGGQDHALSRPHRLRSSGETCASTAARLACRDDRDTPLHRGGMRHPTLHLRKTEAKYFYEKDWTPESTLNPRSNFDFARTRSDRPAGQSRCAKWQWRGSRSRSCASRRNIGADK
jgi:hypothetical protein